ncbi:MAG: hypothetical protein AAF938_26815 [Myxococcota bacterium]
MSHPPPRLADRCITCGERLGARPWVAIDHGRRGEHVACRDWSDAPFPYDSQLRALRRLWRELSPGAVRDEVRLAGQWLRRLRARWPEGGKSAAIKWHALATSIRTRASGQAPSHVLRRL